MNGGIWRAGHSKRVLESLPPKAQTAVIDYLAKVVENPDLLLRFKARGSAQSKNGTRYMLPIPFGDEWLLITIDSLGPVPPLMIPMFSLVAVLFPGTE